MLTSRQHRFIEEYLKDRNATQAAIRAGYSPRTAGAYGHDLLKKHEISTKIREKTEEISEKIKVDVEWVVKELINLKNTAKNEGVKLGAVEFLGKWQGMLKDKGENATTIILKTPEVTKKAPDGK